MNSWLHNLKILLVVLSILAVLFLPGALFLIWITSYEIGDKAVQIFLIGAWSYIFVNGVTKSTAVGRRVRANVCWLLRKLLGIKVRINPAQALEIAKEEIHSLTQAWLEPATLDKSAVVIEQLASYLIKDRDFHVSVNVRDGQVLECYAYPLGKSPPRRLK